MKRFFYTMLGLEIMACMVGCKKDNNTLEAEPQEFKSPTAGSVMYSEILEDGDVIEQSVDSLVNFGDTNNPAYFYVNLSHTVNGIEAQGKHRDNCAFFSTTQDELEKFIPLYAKAQSLSAGGTLTNEEKVTAYQHLYNFIQESDVDVSELVYRTLKNPDMLQSALENSDINILKGGNEIVPVNPYYPFDIDDIPDQIRPYLPGDLGDLTVEDSILRYVYLLRDALQIPYEISTSRTSKSKSTDVDLNANTFVSYLNIDCLNSEQYYATEYFDSPKYVCRYGTKGCPMVECEFYITGWYKSRLLRDKETIYYMPYIRTMVSKIHIGATMRLEGTVDYYNPDIRETDQKAYAVVGTGQVNIEYGDSYLVRRKAQLCFRLDGEKGFQKISWDEDTNH